MAFATSNIPKPIEPAHPKSARGYTPALSKVYRVAASQTIKRGDIIIVSSGKAAVDTQKDADVALTATGLGIANSDLTTTASVTETDVLVVFDMAGNVFVANLISGVATDFTLTDYAPFLVFRNVTYTTDPAGKTVYGIDADTAATGGLAIPLDLVRQSGKAPGDSLINPRAYFVFRDAGSVSNAT